MQPAHPPSATAFWQRVGMRFLPFADAASDDLPLGRLLRLALFQVSVGLAVVLLNGTLNRVLVIELGTPAWIVALMVAIPLLVAPFRALIGHRSDQHRSVLGWRRVPYVWFGTLGQFGGLAIMPFALILLTRADTLLLGIAASSLSFLLTGIGMHMTQTAGIALATDLAPAAKRPRVVALLYVMLLAGMMIAAITLGALLRDFSATRLVQVIQGAAVLSMLLNLVALWKQEPLRRDRQMQDPSQPRPSFAESWNSFAARPKASRLLCAIGIGAMAFAMQDALLEPYGGEILGMAVGATTALTGAWAFGALLAFAYCARALTQGADPLRLAGFGGVIGIGAFLMAIFAAPFASVPLLFVGTVGIGAGAGLFSVGTMVAAMQLVRRGAADSDNDAGLAIGAWGAAQASGAGLGVALGGLLRDMASQAALQDAMGATLATRATGYGLVYAVEILLLLATMVVIGPVIGKLGAGEGSHQNHDNFDQGQFGLGDFPT